MILLHLRQSRTDAAVLHIAGPAGCCRRAAIDGGAAAVRPRFCTMHRQLGLRFGKLTRPNPSGDLEGTKGEKNRLMDCIRRIASVKNICCSGQRKMEVTGRGQSSAVDL